MAIETASYIHQLDSTYPAGNHVAREGDDHIRLLKRTIKDTFPNITGAVTLSHTAINALKKNEANGVPGLDGTGRIAKNQQHAQTQYVETAATRTANEKFNDNVKILVGTGDDLEIYHSGTNTVVTNKTGKLQVSNTLPSGVIELIVDDSGGTARMGISIAAGEVGLYYAGGKKLNTENTGVRTTGDAYITGHWHVNYSDERLKDEIAEIVDPLYLLRNVKLIKYTANETAEGFGYDRSQVELGVRASDVEATMPELIALAPFDRGSDGSSISGENYRTVDYSRLAAVAAAAVGQLEEKLAWETKARVNVERELMRLKNRLDQLEVKHGSAE